MNMYGLDIVLSMASAEVLSAEIYANFKRGRWVAAPAQSQ